MSDFFLKGTVGNGRAGVGDGSEVAARMGRQAELLSGNVRGFYAEQTSRGNKFCLNLPVTSTTIAAGNISAAAAAASTQFAIWNPAGSGVNLELSKLIVAVISGTLPVGPLTHNLMLNGIPTISSTLTNGSLLNCLPSGRAPVARAVAVTAGTALTGGGALSPYRTMAINFSAGTYAALGGANAVEVLDGDIIIPPGYGYVPCWAAAGTTLIGAYSLVFDEVPI